MNIPKKQLWLFDEPIHIAEITPYQRTATGLFLCWWRWRINQMDNVFWLHIRPQQKCSLSKADGKKHNNGIALRKELLLIKAANIQCFRISSLKTISIKRFYVTDSFTSIVNAKSSHTDVAGVFILTEIRKILKNFCHAGKTESVKIDISQ